LALYALYRAGKITLDEALRQADSANNLRIRIKMEDAGAAGLAQAEAQTATLAGGAEAPAAAFTLKPKDDARAA
jgi:twitching motility protein PilU